MLPNHPTPTVPQISLTSDTFVLETERLFLRPHQLDDIPFMVQFSADPEVVRYTGDGALNEFEADEIVKRLSKQFQEAKIGRFIAIEKTSREKIGWSGLAFLPDRQIIDLGYRFLRNKWGYGYATEASNACLKYGFKELQISEINARVDIRNDASINVLQKLRMIIVGIEKNENGEFFDFIIHKDDFLAKAP